MDAETLRQLQAPLKVRYRHEPSSALVTLRARGRVSQAAVSCALETGKPGIPAGLHPAAGGDGMWACSGDLLLESLVGCAGVTLAAVATAMDITLIAASVEAEGEIDFRGTLGVAKEVAVGFQQLRLTFHIESNAEPEQLQKLVQLTERYCVVLQTLAQPPKVQVLLGAASG